MKLIEEIKTAEMEVKKYQEILAQHTKSNDVVTQADASPKPFATQPFNDPQAVRNAESFVSQQPPFKRQRE